MDFFILVMLLATGTFILNTADQRKRIALLGSHLSQYQIEKLMESLTEGYLRALGESDLQRREQIWSLLRSSEIQLSSQFSRFAAEFAKTDAADTVVSTIGVSIPYATRLFPQATFDLRRAFVIHAQGIARAIEDKPDQSAKEKAFTVSAELFLMQHTCHWYCKSKTIASARMLARHQTSYAQLVAAVAPATREAYLDLVGQ